MSASHSKFLDCFGFKRHVLAVDSVTIYKSGILYLSAQILLSRCVINETDFCSASNKGRLYTALYRCLVLNTGFANKHFGTFIVTLVIDKNLQSDGFSIRQFTIQQIQSAFKPLHWNLTTWILSLRPMPPWRIELDEPPCLPLSSSLTLPSFSCFEDNRQSGLHENIRGPHVEMEGPTSWRLVFTFFFATSEEDQMLVGSYRNERQIGFRSIEHFVSIFSNW